MITINQLFAICAILFCVSLQIAIIVCETTITTTFIYLEDNVVNFRHYGENCSSDTESQLCDMKETLACINSTCDCANPLSMTFLPAKGICVGKAGHPCVHHISEASVSPTKKIGQCVMFSTCERDDDKGNANSTCACWSSFYPDEVTGLCVRRRDYLQKCERDEQCNNRKGLVCNKDMGICNCDKTVTRYNIDTERCVGLPNTECANIYRECTENHKCKSGICRCKFKEMEAANGTLLCDPVRHKYGKPCGRFRGDCGDEKVNNLRCLDGKCRCKNPDYQIYDHDRRVCVSKVGGPCIIASHSDSADSSFRNGTHNSKFNPDSFPIIKCIPYAECVPLTINTRVFMTPLINGKGVPGVCECGETFLPTKKGICSLPRGADCDTSSKDKKDQCASPLQCVSGRCDCPNEVDVYEDETKKCAKPVQSLCWKDSSCVKNAMCKLRNKHLPGRCKCLSKFKTTSLSTCV